MSMRDELLQWANAEQARGNPVSIQEIAEHVDLMFRRQAAAAKRGMDAAKAAGSHMEASARRLAEECSPEALESEREANARLTAEVERLERDLATARRDYEVMNKLMEGAEQERDELAAHVERLTAWIKEHGWHSDTCDILDLDEQGCHKACSCGLDVINGTPETSLARLIAEKKTEALEGVLTCCQKCPPGNSSRDVLRVIDQMARAQRDLIRRQAEGEEP